MKWTEHTIARAIALQTLARKCVVLVDNCNWTGHECDVLGVTMDLRIIDVEVKISRADLKADAAKDKWWRRLGLYQQHGPEAPRTHPRKVWKHYYALPAEIWKPELLDCLPSKASGVLLLRHGKDYTDRHHRPHVVVECARRATPDKAAERLTSEQVMDIARLANLRMWEAYRARDAARQPVEATA
ncbi:MAG: hypothetical protein Q8S92_22840 [Hydrogenophaga sp.]|uniref:hypothetical protein n=1 Tax=Hydrogenophaga sp. TaxID=1904254 RepID=UPI0027361EC7|nr:hypothetical protein [Hydrogenophaga sp.]MDP3351832.1 hypothetical protein [Hydrogenophaga sp.]